MNKFNVFDELAFDTKQKLLSFCEYTPKTLSRYDSIVEMIKEAMGGTETVFSLFYLQRWLDCFTVFNNYSDYTFQRYKRIILLLNDNYIERLRLDLTYIEGLESFRSYLCGQMKMNIEKVRFSDIDDDTIRNFLKYLIESGHSLFTRNIKLISIKGYIRYCAEKDITLLPLQLKVSKIKTKKVSPQKHNWISASQVKLLLEQPSKNRTGIRDRFIMLILFSTGMRLNELLECRIGAIHLCSKDSYIYVKGKGDKDRVVPITKETIDNIKIYVDIFHRNTDNNDFLVYTVHDGIRHKMSADNVQRIIKKYAEIARRTDDDFPELHPHMLRHSYGAILYRNNMSKAEIAKLLGHEQESTTEIYVATVGNVTEEAIKKYIREQSAEAEIEETRK